MQIADKNVKVLAHRDVDDGEHFYIFIAVSRAGALSCSTCRRISGCTKRITELSIPPGVTQGNVQLLRAAGFKRVKTTYWNTFLFPLMVLRRMLTRTKDGSDAVEYPKPVDLTFRAVMQLESAVL